MIKKRVLAFFTLLLALGVILSVIQITNYGKITAFAVLDKPEQIKTIDTISASITDYKTTQNQIQVYMTLKERSGTDQQISLEYLIKDQESLSSYGQRKIVLEAKKSLPYIIIIPIKENFVSPFQFTVEIKNNKEAILMKQVISSKAGKKITGFAVSETKKSPILKTLFLFLSFVFLFFVLKKALDYKRKLKEMRKYVNKMVVH